ncbi:hypothetical protein MTO96_018458 [Rhipicephalus appendiculatus]
MSTTGPPEHSIAGANEQKWLIGQHYACQAGYSDAAVDVGLVDDHGAHIDTPKFFDGWSSLRVHHGFE